MVFAQAFATALCWLAATGPAATVPMAGEPRLPANTVLRWTGSGDEIAVSHRGKADEIPTQIIVDEKVLRALVGSVHALSALERIERKRISNAGKTLSILNGIGTSTLVVTLLPAKEGVTLRFSVKPSYQLKKKIGHAWSSDAEIWELKDGKLELQEFSVNWAAIFF